MNAEQTGALNHTANGMGKESGEVPMKFHSPIPVAVGYTKCMYLCMLYNPKFLDNGEHPEDSLILFQNCTVSHLLSTYIQTTHLSLAVSQKQREEGWKQSAAQK